MRLTDGPEDRSPQVDGRPLVIGSFHGWPLEVRVWRERPVNEPDAIYHGSGCWVSVRALRSPIADETHSASPQRLRVYRDRAMVPAQCVNGFENPRHTESV